MTAEDRGYTRQARNCSSNFSYRVIRTVPSWGNLALGVGNALTNGGIDSAMGLEPYADGPAPVSLGFPSSTSQPPATGRYGRVGGHHPHNQAAFKGHPQYKPGSAFAISQQELQARGYNHQAMTNCQRTAYKNFVGPVDNLRAHTRIAVAALEAGGVPNSLARSWAAESLRSLRAMGVRSSGPMGPTHIPWSR